MIAPNDPSPNEVSAELAPQLLDAGMQVIDLSGAFRLEEPSLSPSWYGFTHERASASPFRSQPEPVQPRSSRIRERLPSPVPTWTNRPGASSRSRFRR